MSYKLDIKFSIVVLIAFILFTLLGTITHELGHIFVAKLYGYETTLHYNSMNYINPAFNMTKRFIIVIGGPLQTILTCLFGLTILWVRQSKNKMEFKFIDWVGVFFGLFILREVFNFIMALLKNIFLDRTNFNGDEFKISRYFNLNEWTIPTLMLIIGLIISLYLIFKVIPLKHRFSFILSGLLGGVIGYILWFKFLGPLALP